MIAASVWRSRLRVAVAGRSPPGKLNVITTTEDLAALAREVGGDRIDVEVARARATRIRTSSSRSRASSSS